MCVYINPFFFRPTSAHIKDQARDHGFLIERAENLNRCSWALEPMLAKCHLKIPVHQIAGSLKVQRFFSSHVCYLFEIDGVFSKKIQDPHNFDGC